MKFWRQALTFAAKDLRVEGRTMEVVAVTIPFGAVALLLLPFTLPTNTPMLGDIGFGMFWVVVLLFGMLVAFRRSGLESPATSDVLTLLGVDPGARFVGRVTASTLLMTLFELILGPVAVVLYNPEVPSGWGWLILLAVLMAIGLSVVATLATSLSEGLVERSVLAPLLVAPLAVPLLIGANHGVTELSRGGGILKSVLLLVAADLALGLVGLLSARPLEESSR